VRLSINKQENAQSADEAVDKSFLNLTLLSTFSLHHNSLALILGTHYTIFVNRQFPLAYNYLISLYLHELIGWLGHTVLPYIYD